jgi:hypothetical protein
MANLNGVTTTKGKIGPSVLAPKTSTSLMIITGYDVLPEPNGLFHIIYNMKDAELVGITPEADELQPAHVFRHISEFYRIAGEGTKLYVAIRPVIENIQTILTNIGTANSIAQNILAATDGDVRQLTIADNSPLGASIDQLEATLINSLPLAQGLANWAYDNHFPLRILLEGRNWAGNSAVTKNLRTLNFANVAVVIGQDHLYASATAASNKFADVGTALGTLAAADINQNIGDNTAFDLTNDTKGKWLKPGLSNNIANRLQIAALQTLEDKGFIFGITYVGMAGVRWNNDHVCIPVVIDSDGNINEHTLAYGRTVDEAVRGLRSVLLPKVKTRQPVNPATGLLPPGVVKNFDGIGDTLFGDMVNRGQISGGKTTTDPSSDLIVEKVLKVSYAIVPTGTIGEIKGIINIQNKL